MGRERGRRVGVQRLANTRILVSGVGSRCAAGRVRVEATTEEVPYPRRSRNGGDYRQRDTDRLGTIGEQRVAPSGAPPPKAAASRVTRPRHGRKAADMPVLKARARFLDFGLRGFTSGSLPDSQDPIRAELFSTERLEQHAESVAAQRALAEGGSPRPLSSRVRDSGRVLLRCYRELAAVIREEGAITPAAEWFVDNFHIVDDVLREVREDLPPGFYRQLPEARGGTARGLPARPRTGLGFRRAHRQPLRARDAAPLRPAPTSASSR